MTDPQLNPDTPLKNLVAGAAHTVGTDTTITDVVQIMSSYEIGLVLVEQGDAVVGVVSERDIVRGLAVHDEFALVGSFLDMTAADVMSADPVTAGSGTTVADAVELMRENEVRHLLVPLLEGYGVVSLRDLV